MEQYKIVMAVGLVVALIGGSLAAVGTTSMGLFAFYVVMLLGGLGIVGYANKLRDHR